jgi:hypothetical protein
MVRERWTEREMDRERWTERRWTERDEQREMDEIHEMTAAELKIYAYV